jgi:hypothetical protein
MVVRNFIIAVYLKSGGKGSKKKLEISTFFSKKEVNARKWEYKHGRYEVRKCSIVPSLPRVVVVVVAVIPQRSTLAKRVIRRWSCFFSGS